jgi:hypothetical protein
MLCEIWGSHIDVSYDAGLLEYDAVSLDDQFPVFLKERSAFMCMVKQSKENVRTIILGLLNPWWQSQFLCDTGNHSPSGTASQASLHVFIPLSYLLYAFWQTYQKCPRMERHDYSAPVKINCTYCFNQQSSTEVYFSTMHVSSKNSPSYRKYARHNVHIHDQFLKQNHNTVNLP